MPQPVPIRSRPPTEKQAMSPITKACDMCRQKKIRCNPQSGGCAQCVKYRTPCHFTPISMKRAPRRSAKDQRVEDLEKRLKSMEELMKGHVSDQPPGLNDTEKWKGFRGIGAAHFSEQSNSGSSMSNPNSNSISTASGADSESPDVSLPSPEDTSTQQELLSQIPSLEDNVFKHQAIECLPPKEEVLSLVEKSFESFDPAYPLFDKARLASVLDPFDTIVDDPDRWACLNVVLALASQFQHRRVRDEKGDSGSWGYFQTAFALVGQLMTMHVTLWSIQALLGMALVIEGTPSQGPLSLLVSGALKLGHRMGLHRRCQNPDIGAAEVEERKRIFWIAYSLDKDVSLRMGQPSTQDDDDMDVELPSEFGSSSPYLGKPIQTTYFTFRARLAMIQGEIYKRLYSVRASKAAVVERIVAASALEAMLQSWRATVPTEFMQEYHEPLFQMLNPGCDRHPVILQLLYFNSLATVYNALPAMPRIRELPGPGKPIEFQLLSAPLIYAAEARKAIQLLHITSRKPYACVWAVLYIFVAAATTLLKDIICNPSNLMALSDLKIIEPLLMLLDVLAKSSKGHKSERLGGMHRSCIELFQKAKMAVESHSDAIIPWDQYIMSEPSQEQESTEDLHQRMESISSGYNVDFNSIAPRVTRDLVFAVEQQFQESASL